jgi:H+/Cl- antiporter ClcA
MTPASILREQALRLAGGAKAGVAAGFGGVFGTPVAGMVFALAVLAIGRMRYAAILPCLAAALVADWTCTTWGIGHTPYLVASLAADGVDGVARLDLRLLVAAAAAGGIFGLTSRLVAAAIHGMQRIFRSLVARPVLRPVLCVTAYLASGHRGMYRAQRLDTPKHRGGASPSRP